MNFRHLHYFWVVARAGGVMRASEQLHTTPQTVSAQVKLLEERLGRKLLRKVGRRLELTDDGRTALHYADQIFMLGGELEGALRARKGGERRVIEFRVGVVDLVPKTLACRLLEPAFALDEPVRLVCRENPLDELLGELALHRIDLVIAEQPLPARVSVKAFNHHLGSSPASFFAAPGVVAAAAGFPRCLDGAPFLLPSSASSLRHQCEAWFERERLAPRIAGEFDDAALAMAFAREGRGAFCAPRVLEREIVAQYGVQCIGRSAEIVEDFYAISVERRVTHPCVLAITQAARDSVFGS